MINQKIKELEEKIIERVFNKYSWGIDGKGIPHNVVSHNIDLGKAIRESIKLFKNYTKPKINKRARKSNRKIFDTIYPSNNEK